MRPGTGFPAVPRVHSIARLAVSPLKQIIFENTQSTRRF